MLHSRFKIRTEIKPGWFGLRLGVRLGPFTIVYKFLKIRLNRITKCLGVTDGLCVVRGWFLGWFGYRVPWTRLLCTTVKDFVLKNLDFKVDNKFSIGMILIDRFDFDLVRLPGPEVGLRFTVLVFGDTPTWCGRDSSVLRCPVPDGEYYSQKLLPSLT